MDAMELRVAICADEKLADRLKNAKDKEAFLAAAKALGYDISEETFASFAAAMKDGELTPEELDAVAGGFPFF